MSPLALLPSPLERNLLAVHQRIAAAAAGAGRSAEEVQLLPVTKAVTPALAAALLRLGPAHLPAELAENRADGLEAKAAALSPRTPAEREVRWHFVGHLQRNKARRVVRLADWIHSVDSPHLAATLARIAAEEARFAAEEDRRLGIYLQVDFTGESRKQGMDEPTLERALEVVGDAPHLELLGLMAMGPIGPGLGGSGQGGSGQGPSSPPSTPEVFARVADLARRLEAEGAERFADGRCRLSMGMSGDLEHAVAAGSTCVRIGSDLFRGESCEGGPSR